MFDREFVVVVVMIFHGDDDAIAFDRRGVGDVSKKLNAEVLMTAIHVTTPILNRFMDLDAIILNCYLSLSALSKENYRSSILDESKSTF